MSEDHKELRVKNSTLESIKEAETAAAASGEQTASASSKQQSTLHAVHSTASSPSPLKCFGVKSYLHEFYEPPSAAEQNFRLQRLNSKNKRWRIIWKVSFWLGLITLLVGLSMLVYGYLNKEKPVVVAALNPNAEIVDRFAERFNTYLEYCRVFGFLVFMIGGLILAAALFLPSFVCYKQCIYKEELIPDNTEFNASTAATERVVVDSASKQSSKLADFKHVQPQSLNKTTAINYNSIKSEY